MDWLGRWLVNSVLFILSFRTLGSLKRSFQTRLVLASEGLTAELSSRGSAWGRGGWDWCTGGT